MPNIIVEKTENVIKSNKPWLFQVGIPKTEEVRKKISSSRLGIKFSEKHKKNLSEALKGRIVWNKGKKDIYSKETLEKISKAGIGRKHSEETRKKIGLNGFHYGMLGKRASEETKKKMGLSHSGYKHWNWQGGITRKRVITGFYKNLRKNRELNTLGSHTDIEWLALKIKYNFMCLCCKLTEPEIKLTRDHIIPLSKNGTDFIDNIQPLCSRCNSIKYNKIINFIEQYANSI